MSIFILIVVFGSLIIYAKFGSKSGWRPSFFKRVKFTDIYIYSFGDWPLSVLIHFVPLIENFLWGHRLAPSYCFFKYNLSTASLSTKTSASHR